MSEAHLLLPPARACQRQCAAAALGLLLPSRRRRRLLRPGHGARGRAWLGNPFSLQLLCLRRCTCRQTQLAQVAGELLPGLQPLP